jgi:hypothetical protein
MKKYILSCFITLCFSSYAYTQQYVMRYPDNSNYSTGSVNNVFSLCTKIDDGLVVGTPWHSRGWMKFDITDIPDNVTIEHVEIDLWVSQASANPETYELVLNSLYVDPVTASASTLWNSIDDPPYYFVESSWGDASGQKSKSDVTTMINDVQSSLTKNWFAVGLYEQNEDAGACHITGYTGPVAPYLLIDFSLPAPTNVIASKGAFCDRVRLSWNAVINADRYYIYSGTNLIAYTSNLNYDYLDASTSSEEYRIYAAKSSLDNHNLHSSKYGSDYGYKKPVPNEPGSITGSTSVCQGSSYTYSISSVSGATSYTWSLPSGWSGSSASTSLTTTAGASGGTISVTANNDCGSSTPGTKSIVIASKPIITTSSVSTLSSSSARGGGNITSNGGAQVTVSGVCWSTSSDPTVSDLKTTDGTTTGSFTSTITGLTENKTYYIRAYATNCSGTGYGSNVQFNNNTALEAIHSSAISIYPNPVSNILNIDYKNGNYETLNILNSQGVLLKTEKIISPTQQLDFSNYESGLYILEFVKPGAEIERVRVIKH